MVCVYLSAYERKEAVFASFLQAGFECSTQKLRSGRRLDMIDSTNHDRFVHEDYERLGRLGIATVREGLRWHLIEQRPNQFDFTSVIPLIEAAKYAHIEVIWDLFHFGWPDHLDIFNPQWVLSFAGFAREFARLWKRLCCGQAAFIAPINEISFFSWAAGDIGILNPFAHERGEELKKQLVRGFLEAVRAIRSELPNASIVAPEPVIHIVGDRARPDDVASAEAFRLSMFEAWDMLSGRLHPELGGNVNGFDIIGINYYDRNQWRNYGETLRPSDPDYRPFHQILLEVWNRYRIPLFISETGAENEARSTWFAYVAGEARKAMDLGVELHGICLYPILNHSGWDDDRHCFNGLWDSASPDGSREIYQPLADEIRRQERIRRGEK
jgi:beta-glucosidase/6-phospho-beta-glucosidase/beta-galactosidase